MIADKNRKDPRKAFAVAVVFFLAAFVLLSLMGCAGKKKRILKVKKPSPTPSASPSPTESKSPIGPIEFMESKLQSREGMRKNWVLSAKQVEYNEKTGFTEAETVECSFYDPDNKEVLNLVARGASVNMKTDSLRFQGSVTMKGPDGETLDVKRLRWDGQKKKLIGEGSIRITRKNSITTAKELIADPELKQIELRGDVKVEYPDADKFLKF